MSETFKEISGMKGEVEEKKKEMSTRNREAQIYDLQYDQYRKDIEVVFTLKRFEIDKSDLVLDAGAGTGRFTVELVKRGAEVVAIDYSRESLEINKTRANTYVILADLCSLPFQSSVFDKTISIGVFQHIPTWKSRFKGLEEIQRVSKKRARILVSVYNYRFKIRERARYKQGHHGQNSIYYYRFDFAEFKPMLKQVFPRILDLRGIIILAFLMRRFYEKKQRRLVLILEDLVEKTFLSLLLGNRLIAICEA